MLRANFKPGWLRSGRVDPAIGIVELEGIHLGHVGKRIQLLDQYWTDANPTRKAAVTAGCACGIRRVRKSRKRILCGHERRCSPEGIRQILLIALDRSRKAGR